MADEDKRSSFFLQFVDEYKQLFSFFGRQCGGWFVQDDQFGSAVHGAYNVDFSLVNAVQRGDLCPGIDFQAVFVKLGFCVLVQSFPVYKEFLLRPDSKKNIFSHRQIRDNACMLRYDLDPHILPVKDGVCADLFSFQQYFSGILPVNACNNVDNGGFPCAVSSKQ